MLNRFIVLKFNNELSFIDDFLLGLLGSNIKIVNQGNIKVIYHSYTNLEDIYDSINAIIADEIVEIKGYISEEYNDQEKMDKDIDIIVSKIINPNLRDNIYYKHDLMLELILLEDKKNLDSLIALGVDEVILGFIENNMNTSHAASSMYIHRNTLINRLDKFNRETGFDVRKFKDAFIVYSLFKK